MIEYSFNNFYIVIKCSLNTLVLEQGVSSSWVEKEHDSDSSSSNDSISSSSSSTDTAGEETNDNEGKIV